MFARCLDLATDESESMKILEELLRHQKFTQAREYAVLMDLPRDKISLQEVLYRILDLTRYITSACILLLITCSKI